MWSKILVKIQETKKKPIVKQYVAPIKREIR